VAGSQPLVGVVGACGAGKSTLVAALRGRGIHAREVAQEHSYVPTMWQRFTQPDLLLYLEVSREVAERRLKRTLPVSWWEEIQRRLSHARAHADIVLHTDGLTPEAVLDQALRLLEQRGV
jgi:deoxyadenosine/deoxycytidine kinase